VSRELTRILEFVENVLFREHEQMAMVNALDTMDGYTMAATPRAR